MLGEDRCYVYDAMGRLTEETSPLGNRNTYTYDAENNRIRTETPTYVEEYMTDTVSSSLSRVLSVTVYEKRTGTAQGVAASLTNGTTTLYVYGNGLIYEHTGDLYLYHHYNNLGSTMKLTDQRGEVIATYAYGTYGELLRGDTTLTRFLYNGRCGVATDDNGLYYMRQRYYSPEMKRFLNQDVVRGSLTASQSLNRYSYVQGNPVSYTDPFGLSPLNGLFTGTNFWHAVLGFIGCVPGPVGMVANLADAAVYALIDHDYGMAALAMLDCVSGGLSTLAKAASAAGKATKSARYLKTAGSLISNVSSFAQNASAGMATAFDMYEKYMIKGEEFDSSTPWEIASLGLSIVGMGISGRGMAGDTKALSKMLNEENITGRMRNAAMAFAADNRGCVGGAKGSRKTDFYVTPSGDAVPATGYRYMSSKYAEQTMETMSAPGSYFGFEKFDSASMAQDAFQVAPKWSDCKLRGEFDTLQVIDDMYIPKAYGGEGPDLEPFTRCYPEYGKGGYQQFKYDGIIKFINVEIIGD